MKREEFRARIAAAITQGRLIGVVVDADSIRFQGDEDGDVCLVYDCEVIEAPTGRVQGYHYLDFEDLMNIVCDD